MSEKLVFLLLGFDDGFITGKRSIAYVFGIAESYQGSFPCKDIQEFERYPDGP